MLAYPFDLYSRLYYFSQIINHLAQKKEKIRVLDVGGRDGKLNEFVENNVEITILDIRENDKKEKNYFVGSILEKNKLGNQEFEIVTSCEMLEHINEDKRELAIVNMLDLTSDLLIFSSPIKSKEADQAERAVNNYYKNVHGEDHPWLVEHFDNNLPDKEKIEVLLQEKKFQFTSIGSNNINTWLMMQLFVFTPISNQEKYSRVLRFFNQNFLHLGDGKEPSYRSIYIVSKKNSLPTENVIPKRDFDPCSFNQLINLVFSTLGEEKSKLAAQKDQHIKNLEALLKSKTKELDLIKQSRSWKTIQSINKLRNSLKIRKT